MLQDRLTLKICDWKKLNRKEYIVYDSIYMKYLEYAKNRKCIRGCRWMDNELGEWGVAASRYGIFFWGDKIVQNLHCVDVCTSLWILLKP